MLHDKSSAWIVLACSLALSAAACGGSQPAPQTASGEAPAGDTSSDDTSAAAADSDGTGGPKKAEGNGESWEGEGDANGKGDTANAGTPDKPASDASLPEGGKDGPETRTNKVIFDFVQQNRKPIRKCYDDARKDLPTLAGDMTIEFTLDPKGKIRSAKLDANKSTLKSAAVSDCIVAYLKTLQFPASSRGMDSTVHYPFNFKPDGGG
jgi:hypothetical protein